MIQSEIEEVYREWLLHNAPPQEEYKSTAIGESYHSAKYWDERYDNITKEEWLETLEIHARHRAYLIKNGKEI